MRRLSVLVLLLVFCAPAAAHTSHDTTPIWQHASGWPDRIVTTFEGDPQSSFSVTWRTGPQAGRSIAQIARATDDARFDLNATTHAAAWNVVDLEVLHTDAGPAHTPFNLGLGKVVYHSVTFEDLEPDTLYAWRVQGARGQWSEWFQTRTAPADGPVSFVYFGDAQFGIRSHWSRMIRMADKLAPEAGFILHAGDLVQRGDSDHDWASWFAAGGHVHAQTPMLPVPGNHENMSVWPDDPHGQMRKPRPDTPRERVRSPLWRAQFTLPAEPNVPAHLHESVYAVRYSEDLHVYVVDSAREDFEDQAAWLDAALEKGDARWTVVSMHHPYFLDPAFDRRPADAKRRAAFAPVIARRGVDLVLTGHVHTYMRASERLNPPAHSAGRMMSGDPTDVGPVFMISASGPMSSDVYAALDVEASVGDGKPDAAGLSLDRVAANTPMIQIVRIDGDRLSVEARTATGRLYDAFTLAKGEGGTTQLLEGAAAGGDTRLFSNTGAYRPHDDLR